LYDFVPSHYLLSVSKEGDIVLDPFCGSGVTVIESLKLGRKAIGVDLKSNVYIHYKNDRKIHELLRKFKVLI
jgi:DNA modification methylase